jgi:hypothetical protein
MIQKEQGAQNTVEGTAFVAGGTAVGAGTSALVGGMGLVGGFGGIAVGTAPVVLAGAVLGSAAYGAKKALEEGDAAALGAVTGGAIAGAGVSAVVGGMGLAVGGTAVAIGTAPVIIAGASVGLAVYGLAKICGGKTNSSSSEMGQAISDRLKADLREVQLAKLRLEQAARDEFWAKRDGQAK